ncbi:trypco2 family protein [Streptomyces sp. NPDC057474]|uniref:trypco2 family protein n=1 Tax=Streptomyces sp. NPDC057474 TaxID=3346144 RepID=UPI003687547F
MDIELADAVAVLRDGLLAAVAQGADQDLSFEVGPIELEFLVELRQDVKVKSGFKAWVITGDAEAGLARGRTHRVKFALTPLHRGRGPVWVAAEPDRTRPSDTTESIGR